MTAWSSVSAGLYVGIDLTASDYSPSNGESVTVTARYYVKSANRFSDYEVLHWSFDGSSTASYTFDNTVNNSTQLVLTKTTTYTAGTGSRTVAASCSISGAYNGASPSLGTDITIGGSAGAPTTPTSPPALNGTVTATTAPIHWGAFGTNGSPVTSYTIGVSVAGSGNWSYSTPAGTGLTYTVTGLSPGTTYWIAVRANSAAGSSGFTPSLSVTPGVTGPDDPTNATFTDTSTPSLYQVRVGWTAGRANGATGISYDVYIATAGPPGSPTGTTTATSLTTSVGISSSSTYYAWVRVKSSSPSYTGNWVAAGQITTGGSGATGDLVDRIDQVVGQIGTDMATVFASMPKIASGMTQVSINAATYGTTTVYHGLGTTPSAVVAIVVGSSAYFTYLPTGAYSTQFTVGLRNYSNASATITLNVFWIAVA